MQDWQEVDIYLREDDQQRVWKYQYFTESLLYDFSLSIGDSVEITDDLGLPCTLVVTQTDSLTLADMQPYRRLKLRSAGDPDGSFFGFVEWVEGMGSLYGPLYYGGFCATDFGESLLCFFQQGQRLYHDSERETCARFLTSITEATPSAAPIVYPNPSQGLLSISLPANHDKPLTFYLYDSSGRLIQQLDIQDSITAVSLQAWPAGTYFYRIAKGEVTRYSGSIVKVDHRE